MKILHIYRERNEGLIGGVEYHIKYLVQEQKKAGLEPAVLTFMLSDRNHLLLENRDGIDWYFLEVKDPIHKLTRRLKSFESDGAGFFVTGFESVLQNLFIKSKLQIIDEINPDIVHQHDYLSSVRLSKRVAEKFRIIFTNHYGAYLFLKKSALSRRLQHYFLNQFRYIIAPSHNLLPETGNSYFIPNGVNTGLFNEITAAEKKALKSNQKLDHKVVFLCARRWAPTKGVLYLAQALNLLADEVKDKAVFLFAGNDAEDFMLYKKQVQTELSKCKGVDYRLHGNLNHNELMELIRITDVGLIPSLMEGMSLFSIELISCGIPILATHVGGLPEIIKVNENGWLVEPKNAKALADEITKIVKHWPDSNLSISTADFKEKYDWASIAEQTITIYKKL